MGDDEQRDEEGRGFTVVDRRGREEAADPGGASGPGTKAPEGGADRPSAGEARPSGGEAGEGPGFTLVGEPHAEAEPGPEALPPVDFSGLALSLATSALYHMGLVADPQTGAPGEKDLRLARHSIDTLELLQDKTRGNLTDEESRLLANLLTELRMRFVEAGREA